MGPTIPISLTQALAANSGPIQQLGSDTAIPEGYVPMPLASVWNEYYQQAAQSAPIEGLYANQLGIPTNYPTSRPPNMSQPLPHATAQHLAARGLFPTTVDTPQNPMAWAAVTQGLGGSSNPQAAPAWMTDMGRSPYILVDAQTGAPYAPAPTPAALPATHNGGSGNPLAGADPALYRYPQQATPNR